MIYRISIANADPRDVAYALHETGLGGTVVDSYGAGGRWGVEPGALAIVATDSLQSIYDAVHKYVHTYDSDEEAVYIDNGVSAWLYYPGDGSTEPIAGGRVDAREMFWM